MASKELRHQLEIRRSAGEKYLRDWWIEFMRLSPLEEQSE